MRGKYFLKYNERRWEEFTSRGVNTLQLFITNKCNLRCAGCFYSHKLGKGEMSLPEYKNHILEHENEIKKVILLGGEPTLHPDLGKMIEFNNEKGLATTIYTNGSQIKSLEGLDLSKTQVRLGVYGSFSSEKPLYKILSPNFPVTVVYMLRTDNIHELDEAALMAEHRFNCNGFYISSIRDITSTQDFWKDTPETVPLDEYSRLVQSFVDTYNGEIPVLHIARRGVIETKKQSDEIDRCRFGNIFPDAEKIICPFDISRRITTDKLVFGKRPCNKNKSCILKKIVLRRK
ncbi:MAG: radical SAM protein [Candidatus Pacearchaeota archaeon]|jgi:hypothetical protein